ncbi:hypothetical protein [Pseudomonas syringae]|uniref:hypothetical protein n=1 Tax=Pseudomonas syringae TaxID=317 RepID=UPI000A2229D4|nr:hypothetical protein [Pseudomonas syringae]OSR67006.1 hypothetical protein BV327_04871 [Pseudomonas syringae pv. actinidiae]
MALLSGISVPGLPVTSKARELKFQVKYEGTNTDDLVLIANNAAGKESRLFAQIKHAITIGAQDSVFAEVIKSAWEDFKTERLNDRPFAIALITGPLPKKDVSSTLPVLEWARYSATAEEFIKKSHTEGFTSIEKLEKLEVFRIQLKSANGGQDLTNDELWQFLRIFYCLSFDLDSSSSIVGSMMGALIRCHSEEAPHLVVARLFTCAQEFNQNAGTLTATSAPQDLIDIFQRSISYGFDEDIKKLRERGDHIFNGISTTIGGIHIQREEDVLALEDALQACEFVFVTGERGAGKSGVVKDFISTRLNDLVAFYLRAEDLDKSHLNDVFSAIGMKSTLGALTVQLSLVANKVLVIESAEKILELNYQAAFVDLLKFIKGQGGWKVIATGRDYAYQKIAFNYLQLCQVSFSTINVRGFSSPQLDELYSQAPMLKPLVENESLSAIIKIPFFTDLAMRAISNGAIFGGADTESEFRHVVWNTVISNDADRRGGLHTRRKLTFISIAKKRAKEMLFGVHERDFDPEAVSALEADHLIFKDKRAFISPSHDVLEDWALEEFVDEEYCSSSGDPHVFLTAIGSEPAINRGYRLWLQRKLNSDDNELIDFVDQILSNPSIENYWKDETITAVLQGDDPGGFLGALKTILLKNNNELLLRFMFVLQITCQRPWAGLGAHALKVPDDPIDVLILQPCGNGWAALLNFVYDVRDQLATSCLPSVMETISAWGEGLNIKNDLPEEARVVGLLALHLLEPIKDAYRQEELRRKILDVILKVSPVIRKEFESLVDKDVFVSKRNPHRLAYVKELCQLILQGANVVALCKHSPDFVVRLARHEWFKELTTGEFDSHHRMDIEASFGLDTERSFNSASGLKGPFKYLLLFSPRLGLDFIIELCNWSVDALSKTSLAIEVYDSPVFNQADEIALSTVKIQLNDEVVIESFSSFQLWSGYRGFSNIPSILQSALMALENWLINYVEQGDNRNEIEWIYNYILKSSNSVLPTGVLASIATAFPDKVAGAAFPLLRSSEFYALDLRRQSQEHLRGGFFGDPFNNDPWSKLYAQERAEASKRLWRNHSLERVLVVFQLDETLRDNALKIVDDLKAQALHSQNENLRFTLHRVDSRNFSVVSDKESQALYLRNEAELPQDLKVVTENFARQQQYDSRIHKLYVWAKKNWDDGDPDRAIYSTCFEALAESRLLVAVLQDKTVETQFRQMAVGAIRTTAALCVRDELENLEDYDLHWVVTVVLDTITESADAFDSLTASDATDSYGTVACAFVLSRFFTMEVTTEAVVALKYHMGCALTHPNFHVRVSAAKGISRYLWAVDPDFASHCLQGAMAYGNFEIKEVHTNHYVRYQCDAEHEFEELRKKNLCFRTDFSEGRIADSLAVNSIDECPLEVVHLPMLMLPIGANEAEHQLILRKVVGFVYDHQYKEYRQENEFRLDTDSVKAIQECLVAHVLHSREFEFESVRDLLILGCSRAPTLTHLVKLSFDVKMEKSSDFDAIWALWQVLEPGLEEIAKTDVNSRYSGRESDLNRLLRSMLYLGFTDNGHPSNKICLERGKNYLLNFARKNGQNSHVFESLCSLMYRYPEMFFADGISIAAEKYEKNPEIISMQMNSTYYLEMSIARYLQIDNRGPLSRKMHKSFLSLLTGIVETGSARAYYLRDNLVSARRIAL